MISHTPAHQARKDRRNFDLSTKKVKLAAALSARATKDSSDAAVFGVLPSARAVSKVAARRVAQRISKGGDGSDDGGKESGAASLIVEVAAQIADEYSAEIKRGAAAATTRAVAPEPPSVT